MIINSIKKKLRNIHILKKYNKFKNVNIDFIDLSLNSNIQIDNDSVVNIKSVYLNDYSSIRCRNNAKLKIGKNVHFNNGCILTCRKNIIIGDNCSVGPNVMIFDHDHDYKSNHCESEYTCCDIEIGDNVWIGSNVIILKGSKIGSNCVIGAGTVVKELIPDNSLVYSKKNNIIKQIKR